MTPKQVQALASYFDSGDVSQAAAAAGVNRRTLTRWMAEDSVFKAALAEGERQAMALAAGRLVRLVDKAISVFERVLDSETATPALQLKAADSVVEKVIKLRELIELEGRVKALEERIK